MSALPVLLPDLYCLYCCVCCLRVLQALSLEAQTPELAAARTLVSGRVTAWEAGYPFPLAQARTPPLACLPAAYRLLACLPACCLPRLAATTARSTAAACACCCLQFPRLQLPRLRACPPSTHSRCLSSRPSPVLPNCVCRFVPPSGRQAIWPQRLLRFC